MLLFDGLKSLVSNMMGSLRDKTVNVGAVFTPIDPAELAALYRGNAMARKITEIPPGDMVREWRRWVADEAIIGKLETAERELMVIDKFREALVYARLYGGAAIFIGLADNTPQLEINPAGLGLGAIRYLTVLPRHLISHTDIEHNPLNPRYGLPKAYRLAGTELTPDVHPSRVIHFPGAPNNIEDPWGDSIFETIRDAIIQDALVAQNTAHLTGEMKLDIIEMDELASATLTEQARAKIIERFELGAIVRGNFSTLLLGNGERHSQKQLNLTALAGLIDAFSQRVCAAADIPAPRLIGRHPGGLNSSGVSDIRNYYDRIAQDQRRYLRPRLEQLDAILWPHAVGAPKPADAWFEFNPLWQMDAKEAAEVSSIKAKTVQTHMDTGLVPHEVLQAGVKAMLTEDTLLPGIERAWAEFTAGTLEPLGGLPGAANENEDEVEAFVRRAANDAAPRTLYVMRPVENAAEIIAWAKGQGFETILPAADMHVTIAYSRQPLDWMKIEGDRERIEIEAGGPRVVEPLGDQGAIVLLFSSWELGWRHDRIKQAGASWDHEGYSPHITISYSSAGVSLDTMEPYRGRIVLGPEKFSEVDEDWKSKVEEK